jgi:SAM-dependent methyltransferase
MGEAATGEFPIRMGTPKQFELLRNYFRGIGFEEDKINDILPVDDNGNFNAEAWEQVKFDAVPAALRVPFEVFVRGLSVPGREFQTAVGEEVWSALWALGLLDRKSSQPDHVASPIWLYPLDGFIIVSDRFDSVDGGSVTLPTDIIFAGLNHLTKRFLRLLPDVRGGDAIDLCGGCGVGAMHLARTAGSAVSADITPRSTFFTEFNARLNGVGIATLCGDLFEPAGDRQFDVVSAHPPFVPSVGSRRMIFRDADDFGESITRRIVNALPARLRVGGTAIIVCTAWDTEQPLERRAREWLGDAAPMFDVVSVQYSESTIDKVVEGIRTVQKDVTEEDLRRFAQDLNNWGARQRIYGALMFRRSATPIVQPPVRVHASEETVGADLQRLLDWRQMQRVPGFAQRAGAARPRLSPYFEMSAHFAVENGELVGSNFVLQTSRGLLNRMKPDVWIAQTVSRFDGKHTAAEVLAAAQADGIAPKEIVIDQFAEFLGLLAERGFIELEIPR